MHRGDPVCGRVGCGGGAGRATRRAIVQALPKPADTGAEAVLIGSCLVAERCGQAGRDRLIALLHAAGRNHWPASALAFAFPHDPDARCRARAHPNRAKKVRGKAGTSARLVRQTPCARRWGLRLRRPHWDAGLAHTAPSKGPDMRQDAPPPYAIISLVLAVAWGALTATAPAAAHWPPPPAAPTRQASSEPDELAGLLTGLDRAEIDELVRTALVARLRVERRQVAAEIRSGVLYSAADVGRARGILGGASDTLVDNVDRICRAFAAVDEQLALALDLHRHGSSLEAAEAVRKILDPHQITYLSAAKHLLHADALAACGQDWEAADAYAAVWERMPDRVSLAAVAALRAAQTWEKTDRGFYAWRMYEYVLRNYGLSLGQAEADRLTEKAEQLRRIYEDPFRTLAEMMAPIRSRLAGGDSGTLTQQSQDEVARLIEDLIRTEPGQYLWVHRRWKTRPKDEIAESA